MKEYLMKGRPICLLLVGLLIGGCSDVTGPEGETAFVMGDDAPIANLSSRLVRPGSDPIPDLQAGGGVGQVSIRGALSTPDPCYDLEAYGEQSGAEIHFTINAVQRPGACIAVVATFAYEGVLRGVPPGSYQVRIAHSVNGHSTQVLDTTVSVR